MASVLSFFLYEKGLYFDEKQNFKNNYSSNFSKDSTIITAGDFFSNFKNQAEIEKSEFLIQIFKSDTLLYWNKEENAISSKENLVKQFNKGQFKYRITLDSSLKNYRSGSIDFLLFWAWLLGLAFIGIWAYPDINLSTNILNQSKSNVWISFTFKIILLYCIGFFSGKYIFLFSKYYGNFSTKLLDCSIWQFGLNLIVITLSYLQIQKNNVQKYISSLKPEIRYFLASAFICSFTYYLIVNIELLLKFGNIEIKTEELLNIGYCEFTFYVLVALHLFLFIYLARQFFFATPIFTKVWIKTIAFIVPLIVFTIIFIMMGFDTNTIGVVLFLMMIFLLLDLYFEYFEISISFILIAVLVFAIFTSTLIFKTAELSEESKLSNAISNVYHKLNTKDLEKFKEINDSIASSKLFPSLSNLASPNINIKDLKYFIQDNKIKELSNYTIGEIYCYDSRGNSLAVNQISNRRKIDNLLANSDQPIAHLYYSPVDQTPLLHYLIDNIADQSNPINLAILFSPKKKKEVVLPYKYSLAAYKNDFLVRTWNDENYFPKILTEKNKNSTHELKKINEYSIVKKVGQKFITRFLSLVTLMITIIGILLLILIVCNSIFHFINEKNHLSFNTNKSLRSRFQTTIVGLVLLSFTLIGVTTAFFYNKLYSSKNLETFSTLLNVITKDIQSELPEVEDARNDERIEKLFSKINNMQILPIAFYDAEGKKLLNSDGFDNSPTRLKKSFINGIAEEKQGKILYNQYVGNQIIVPTYNSSNSSSGFFLIEDSKSNIKYAGLFDFISTLLTVCVFLFLTALALSMIITRPMTRSLKNLAQRLKSFKLGRTNESLEWKNPDEIGALIENFNKMQVELNQSADLLSKTQRDLAWREMAKQVAHEIKNPLTPMKLSIQHMQNAAQTADEFKMKNLISKTSTTILEQIENLTQIADEFSSFGTLPKASNDTIILNEVVEHIHDLFRKRGDMDINMAEPMNEIYVFADKNQLVRILNNIVKNATQSIPEDRRGIINIELSQNEHSAILKVSDNGVGITDDMKEKVFTPNFTTKSSGTGLGLAISSNMIESMNGRIYFKSPNLLGGTDFFIELPLLRNIKSSDEVILD